MRAAVINIHFCLSWLLGTDLCTAVEHKSRVVRCRLRPCSQAGHSPLDPLHHVRYQFVRDAWAGLLSQAKGVLQLLHGSHVASSLLVLIFELQPRNRALGLYLVAESTGQEVQPWHKGPFPLGMTPPGCRAPTFHLNEPKRALFVGQEGRSPVSGVQICLQVLMAIKVLT